MSQLSSFPHPTYVQTVLGPNYDDARRFFLHPLLALHRAHAVMLAECGILPEEDAGKLLECLDSLHPEELSASCYDGTVEDFFFFVEREISRRCGPGVAGKLHTARSRNDVDITLYRMVLREEILRISEAVSELRTLMLSLARIHAASLMPAYTHTQPAQPTTLGHYLAAVLECLERDQHRLLAAYGTVNRNPLGACAITTTGFPIQRRRTAALLGFDGLQENSIGAIAATDYVMEAASAIAILAVNLGKFTQDLLLWCTQEFGFLRVGDAWAQISSIMPQKRNPVAFEHVRILLSRTVSQCQGVLTCSHNTPFGDIVDSEDDLWPLVFHATGDAHRAVALLRGALADATIHTQRMRELAGARFITVTELADTLVRDGGLSFAEAHHLVSAAVKACDSNDQPAAIVDALESAAAQAGSSLPISREAALRALDPAHFVAIRNVAGGPGREALHSALDRAELSLHTHQTELAARRLSLVEADKALHLSGDRFRAARNA
jgi:argininosuccinate lyase